MKKLVLLSLTIFSLSSFIFSADLIKEAINKGYISKTVDPDAFYEKLRRVLYTRLADQDKVKELARNLGITREKVLAMDTRSFIKGLIKDLTVGEGDHGAYAHFFEITSNRFKEGLTEPSRF